MNFLEISGLIFWICIIFCIIFVTVCIADAPTIEDDKREIKK